MNRKNDRVEIYRKDYENRINPTLMTTLLHKAVPVLQHCDWRITKVDFGFSESMLPLNAATTNQHGTHQAALISLAADYTGGMALTTLLTGVPLAGIHQCKSEDSASLWLAAMNVKYLNPSTGHLTGRCIIDEKTQRKIRDRYFQGKRVLVSLPIIFTSNGQKVAEADLRYFAQPTTQLLTPSTRPSTLFKQKLKASARMIAGVRASDPNEAKIRVDCPHAATAAGPHGQLLAKRLKATLPQLTDMVLARTKHIDQTIQSMCGIEQVVLLGAGLDMRPFRFADMSPEICFYEVDLPEMLEERERVISEAHDSEKLGNVKRYTVKADFLRDCVSEKLLSETPFDPSKQTLFVYEGCSMYFTDEQNNKLLQNVWTLAKHPKSKIWCDVVKTSVVNGETKEPEIVEFLAQMEDLGESFIFGADDPGEFAKAFGCKTTQWETSREYLNTTEPIFDVYQFCVGGR